MADWPYNTSAWRRLRKAKLAQDPLCQYCMPHKTTIATEVDHAKPINAGGDPWAWDNLASCCHSCHSSKTAADKQGKPWRRKGCDVEGRPLDPSDWFNR